MHSTHPWRVISPFPSFHPPTNTTHVNNDDDDIIPVDVVSPRNGVLLKKIKKEKIPVIDPNNSNERL